MNGNGFCISNEFTRTASLHMVFHFQSQAQIDENSWLVSLGGINEFHKNHSCKLPHFGVNIGLAEDAVYNSGLTLNTVSVGFHVNLPNRKVVSPRGLILASFSFRVKLRVFEPFIVDPVAEKGAF